MGGLRGTLDIGDSRFVGNQAIGRDVSLGGPASSAYGGGVFVNSGMAANLVNCSLCDNAAIGGAGNAGVPVGAGRGGGAYRGTLYDCIAYFNSATSDTNSANYGASVLLNYCCTTPRPSGGAGNFTNDPRFVDTNGWSNLRLQSNSPCINAGNNSFVRDSTDLDGRPRIVGGRVDMGAYEFQPGVSGAFIGWLQQNALPTDGSADFTDADGDGHNNWQEWRCGTCPTNNGSVLRLLSTTSDGTNVLVSWQSVAGLNYVVECSTNLGALPCFTCVAANVVGQPDITTFVHPNAAGPGAPLYRVGVGN